MVPGGGSSSLAVALDRGAWLPSSSGILVADPKWAVVHAENFPQGVRNGWLELTFLDVRSQVPPGSRAGATDEVPGTAPQSCGSRSTISAAQGRGVLVGRLFSGRAMVTGLSRVGTSPSCPGRQDSISLRVSSIQSTTGRGHQSRNFR
jgi:hypothetical protein